MIKNVMSTSASASMMIPPPDDSTVADRAASRAAQNYWKRAWIDTFRNKRAQVSAVWIGLLVFCAVFAPLLANTHPLLLKQNNQWSSPFLRYLTPPDVSLIVIFFVAASLLLAKSIPYRGWIFIGATLATIVVAYLIVKPADVRSYGVYRLDQKAGKIQHAIYAPVRYSPVDRQFEQEDVSLQPPSREHWLGTDGNGADVLSRIIHAARIALAVGFIATGIEVLIGVIVGGVMGYFVGRVDLFGMRLIEIFEAIPTLFLLITFTAFYERNLYMIMAIIGLTSWTGVARFVRGEFLRLRNQDFVQAARAAGLPLWSVLFRHMLPNALTPVLVSASFGVASAILLESVLSFLGLGLVEEPSWGGMLEQARNAGRFVWWLALYPGLAIFLTVFSYNLIGESMRDALDPKLRGIE
jgi:peptide/nickel transport system permease protein